ncbi:aminoacyl-histidine dipeptidase [Carboxylicivirga sediminis]|uniref:Cytosol non-specific dipeptidase n=1 Tax=Carboxylicivirga sediminis TaxID=2006564 RepID=A0A941FCD9_9BACT|nr:aminoacyl-histidine dipeptidase [Carboxylicivirga sediminis]MBR8538294.1 aminoacyl-histidine dipeptidase [Carboxylicivirga sediminis]
MNKLSGLHPQEVWTQFEAICQVPRPSKKEEKIIEFLLKFAEENGLEAKKDEIGNVLISKPATPGKENLKSVVLQSHIDMVCEKNSDKKHDFDNDPITPVIDGDWVKADGTTLGADDGIGMAAQMALLIANDIEHGPIECLFTVDEETGLSGAFGLKEGFFNSSILLNLDSEDDGELFIGCAGGVDTLAKFPYQKEAAPEKGFAFKVSVSGLKGGHSGDDINKGLGNANKILNRFLWETSRKYDLRLASFDGGNLRNAIAREAHAIAVVPNAYKEQVRVAFNLLFHDVQMELKVTEPGLRMKLESVDVPAFVMDNNTQNNLLNALYACPHGVIEMSRDIEGLVETSTNLASVKMQDDHVLVTTSQRSSVESSKEDIANMVDAVFTMAGAEAFHTDGYPGWAPNTDSEILKITKESYERLFGNEPVVRAIHAGLECGLFLEKYPGMDMISFGPTIRGAHSPDERIDIETVDKFWKHLIDVLKNIPEA